MNEKKRGVFIFLMFFYTPLLILAQKNIPMVLEDDSVMHLGPRSIVETPFVAIDGSVLSITFSTVTSSQVTIDERQSNELIYSRYFAFSIGAMIDFEEENVSEGNYVIRICAYGKRWRGEFAIE